MNYIFKLKFISNLKTSYFSTNSTEIIFKENKRCGNLILNRPKALNSLSNNMVTLIYQTLLKWKKDINISHVLIEGAGNKAFCAGGDIRSVSKYSQTTLEESKHFFYNEYILNHLIGSFGKPIISLINGIFMGGGFGISVHGKYRVVTEKALFAMPETAIGLYPDVGGSYVLPRLSNNLGIYMGLVGQRLKGKDILSIGVGTHFVNSQQLNDLKEDLAGVSSDSEVEEVLKKYHDAGENRDFCLLPFLDLINKHFSKDSIEAILKSLTEGTQSEEAVSSRLWCQTQIDILRKMSPTSLKITIRQLREGRNLSFEECFKLEYRLSCRCLENADFHEGVRALLVDKDNKPQWRPATIEEVTDEMVDQYFKPLEKDLIL